MKDKWECIFYFYFIFCARKMEMGMVGIRKVVGISIKHLINFIYTITIEKYMERKYQIFVM